LEPPTGTQFEILSAGHRVVVVEVGAGLREYEFKGQPVLDGFGVEAMPDGARGQPLLPWPNRLADGQYEFGGQRLQLPIDEVSRHNASHGLTRWLNWTLVSHTDNRVELQHVLHPRPGYPFTLKLDITYSVGPDGLSVQTRAHNLGQQALPFGAGQHPYFTLGTPTVDALLLRIPAESRLDLDPERRLPTGRILATRDTPYDFRASRAIGTFEIDACFAELAPDQDGRIRVMLSAPNEGRRLTVWMDPPYRYVQAFTGDTLAVNRRRNGIAIEPMTCPPNAFATHTDVVVLEPDATVDLAWGLTPEF
jgi:aldose 1-epimerase